MQDLSKLGQTMLGWAPSSCMSVQWKFLGLWTAESVQDCSLSALYMVYGDGGQDGTEEKA